MDIWKQDTLQHDGNVETLVRGPQLCIENSNIFHDIPIEWAETTWDIHMNSLSCTIALFSDENDPVLFQFIFRDKRSLSAAQEEML